MNHDDYYRHNKQPKVAIGVQKPTYPLPPTDNFAGWTSWLIQENKIRYAKKLPNENNNIIHPADVITFHTTLGLHRDRDVAANE